MAPNRPTSESSPHGGRAAIAALALLLAACQGNLLPVGETSNADPDPAPLGDEILEAGGTTEFVPRVELDEYAGDVRMEDVAAGWSGRVERALDRLHLITGLRFPADVAPHVVLAPLGDEAQPFVVGAAIVGGRRIPRLVVNVEPLAGAGVDVDRVLLEGLAAARFEDTSFRHTPVAPWVVRAAGTAARGDLDHRLLGLARARDRGELVQVDAAVPAAAGSTGIAAVLVLLGNGGPEALRRFLRFSAEGDDPDALLAGVLQDPYGRWSGPAREQLLARLEGIDVGPWRGLARARTALVEMGRVGLESVLPAEIPGEIAAEVEVLLAAGAADVGNYDEARRRLGRLGAGGLASLDDPAGAAALRIRVEAGAGAPAAVVDLLVERWRRDFPRAARTRAAELPDRESGSTSAPASLGLEAAGREIARLLTDHRAGAARRLLEAMGERGLAPELSPAWGLVADAESEPSPAAIQTNAERVRAWTARPDDAGLRADVRDGGAAAAHALADELRVGTLASRATVIRLLAESAGGGTAVKLLAPQWRARPAGLRRDLEPLAAVLPHAPLRLWVSGLAPDAVAAAGGDRVWEELRLGLDPIWVREHPTVLIRMRDPEYDTRRSAFDEVVAEAQETPGFAARGLDDPSALLRREAAAVAGRRGFRSLVEYALADSAWIVRQTACTAVGRAHGDAEAPRLLLPVFRVDPAPQVRVAALRALLPAAAADDRVIDALLEGLANADSALRDELAGRLPELPAARVLPAVHRALVAEAARPAPRPAVLSRLFLVFERRSGFGAGYYPSMPPAELQRILSRIGSAAERAREGAGS